MQLDATLRSFFLHCQDAGENALVRVIYKASNERHVRQYNELSMLYPEVVFIKQTNFRRDLMKSIAPGQAGPLKTVLYKLFAETGSIGFSVNSRVDALSRRFFDVYKIRFLKMLLSKGRPDDGVLFLVDDNIFVRRFFLAEMMDAVLKEPETIGFSLRLGRNTQYCYTMRQEQSLPDFEDFSKNILKFNWTSAELEFAYPLEISSSLYLVSVILPLLMTVSFSNPNGFEAKIAARSTIFKNQYPELLCFNQSVTFCNPINVVQSVYANRAGELAGLSAEHLSELFAQGKRVNIHLFDGFTSNACHQEVKLTFEDRPR